MIEFEKYKEIDRYKKFAYEYVKDNYNGFNSLEDAIEELDYFFQYDIEYLLDDIILYRVLELEDIDDLDDNIGYHYIHRSKKVVQSCTF